MVKSLSVDKTKLDHFAVVLVDWVVSHKIFMSLLVVIILGYHVVSSSIREDNRYLNAGGGKGNVVFECGSPFSVCLFSEAKKTGRYFGNSYLSPRGLYLFRKESLLGFFFGVHTKGDVDYWTKYEQSAPDTVIIHRWWGRVGNVHTLPAVSVSENLFPELLR